MAGLYRETRVLSTERLAVKDFSLRKVACLNPCFSYGRMIMFDIGSATALWL
jgi:hypothetical protein